MAHLGAPLTFPLGGDLRGGGNQIANQKAGGASGPTQNLLGRLGMSSPRVSGLRQRGSKRGDFRDYLVNKHRMLQRGGYAYK
jgi:hypothetical protein